MSLKKLPGSETERIIYLWKNETELWDVLNSCYANADDRKAALACISQEISFKSNLIYEFIYSAPLVRRFRGAG